MYIDCTVEFKLKRPWFTYNRAECTFINNTVWCAVGWSEIALFAIFENEPSAADQV